MPKPKLYATNADRQKAYRERLKAEGKKPVSGKSGQYKKSDPKFVGCDGESVWVDGEQVYCLFASSSGKRIGEPGKPIATRDFLDFLLSEGGNSRFLVAYGAGYDIECGLRDLTPDQWKKLRETPYSPTEPVWLSIGGKRYGLSYLPNKKLTVHIKGKRVAFYNVHPFFQMGFLSVITGPKRLVTPTPEEEALIEWGKKARLAFTPDQWEEIVAYNDAECKLLVRVMDRLWQALKAHDIRPASWHGPGAIAKALFAKHEMKAHLQKPPQEVWEACARAYFGGRNQCFKIGTIEEAYNYDLGSAYPWGIAQLPSTVGTWEAFGPGVYYGDTPWCLYHVRWDVGRTAEGKGCNPLYPLTPFPWREASGTIHFPPYGEGWYWGPEVHSAITLWGGERFSILGGYLFKPSEYNVFRWLLPLCDARMKAKEEAQNAATQEEREQAWALERAGKLGPNSLYGQTAQTAGRGPYYSPIWSGLITSLTRSRIMEAAALNPKSLILLATDGLFTQEPLPNLRPKGKGLGEWDGDETPFQMDLYQSGVYTFFDKGKSKTRGFDPASISWRDVREVWKEKGPRGIVTVEQKFLCGHRQALHEGKPHLQGKFVVRQRELRLSPTVGNSFAWQPEPPPHVPYMEWHTYDYDKTFYLQGSAPFRKWSDLERDGVTPYACDTHDGYEDSDTTGDG